MDLKNKIDALEHWLFSTQKELSGVAHWLQRITRILFAVIRDMLSGNLTLHAMSLVYTTLLSIVPMLALSFSVVKAMGGHNKLTPLLYNFFEPMGPQGIDIADNMLGFVDNIKVGVLGSVGLALLVYTAISLVQKIERSFNYVWRAAEPRSFSQRFTNYLSVIMVGPLLVVSAIGMTATIMNSSLVNDVMLIEPFGFLIALFSKMLPFVLIIAAFTFVYIFMPNTQVRFRSALLGGIVGGSIWQMTGVLFASFVVNSAKYEAIYSGFAVGIVLLIWLYVCWLILLLGSSIAYYDQNFNHITRSYEVKSSAEISEKLAMAIMLETAGRYERSDKPLTQGELDAKLKVPAILTRDVTDKLLNSSLLLLVGEKGDSLVPARPLDKISVFDVLKAARSDEEGLLNRLVIEGEGQAIYGSIDHLLEDQFNRISIQQILREF